MPLRHCLGSVKCRACMYPSQLSDPIYFITALGQGNHFGILVYLVWTFFVTFVIVGPHEHFSLEFHVSCMDILLCWWMQLYIWQMVYTSLIFILLVSYPFVVFHLVCMILILISADMFLSMPVYSLLLWFTEYRLSDAPVCRYSWWKAQ